MDYSSEKAILEALPMLLAGPILRRTESTSITVWVALKQPCQIDLSVLETQNDGEELGRCVFRGNGETVALGKNLHIAAVTARKWSSEPMAAAGLESGRIYAYDLAFSGDRDYSLDEALSRPSQSPDSISYFAHQKPTFTLPPKALSELKIVHGSCRKPHGEGFDALPILDCLLESDARSPRDRPHQLFMTGDQIYGDDVADPLLWLATPLGNALLGWEEELPVKTPLSKKAATVLPKGSRAGQSESGPHKVLAKQLPAGKRANFATRQAGLTAGLENKSERTTSHLFSFGEYCAVYLLAYSPACWPTRLPRGQEATQGRKTIRRWNNDKRNMEQFLYSLWKVRRLVANIPTYTIFDDHDVSDDWNLNQEWCLRILGKPLGRRTVRNAMLAYSVFQAWGNTPEQFELETSGRALLKAAEDWSGSEGKDEEAADAISTYLGLPLNDPHTGLPQFVEDKSVWIFKRSDKAIRWHYTVRSACHEVIVLDTRTWRGYPIEGKPTDPPMLLCPSAFQQQLQEPLSATFNDSAAQVTDTSAQSDYRTFIVAPTNVFGMRVLDWIQQWHLEQRKTFTADVGDSWNFHNQALATLLTTFFQHREKVVVLSGDIHYSSVIHVDYKNLATGHYSSLVQFTSSAMKNEEGITRILHTRLKDWLLPERPRQWIGWLSPPDMMEASSQKPTLIPDWHIDMRWLKRRRAQSVELKCELSKLLPPKIIAKRSFWAWLQFWKARWLQEGQEVVGMNNIALVYFQPGEETEKAMATGVAVVPTVRQEHYWFSPWSPTQVVCSRFE